MKRKIIALICLSILGARAQQEQTVMDLNCDSPFMLKDTGFGIYPQNQGPQVLAWRGWDPAPMGREEFQRRITLFRIPNPGITSSRYAITGKVAYGNLPDDTQLEMVAVYIATDSGIGGTFYARTNETSGPQAKLTGSSPVRPFSIPMAISNPGKLIQLEFNIWIHGHATVEDGTLPPYGNIPGYIPAHIPGTSGHEDTLSVQDMKLVQYATADHAADPASNAGATPQALTLDQVAGLITAQHDHAIKVTWFWIGVGATTSILFILAGCAVIFHEVRKKSKEHELRRIASLDS